MPVALMLVSLVLPSHAAADTGSSAVSAARTDGALERHSRCLCELARSRVRLLASGCVPWGAGDADAPAGSSFDGVVGVVDQGVVACRRCRTPSARSVAPSRLQGWRWWASHKAVGLSHPSAAQRKLCRIAIATRCGLENSRRIRPWSRTSLLPPRTTGMRPASQAIRRASPGERRVPVSIVAAPSPPWRVSSGMVTTTVALSPPECGSRLGSRVSIRRQNASPMTRWFGPLGVWVATPSASTAMLVRVIASARLGLAIACSTVRSMSAWRVESLTLRCVVPSRSSQVVNHVLAAAASSSWRSRRLRVPRRRRGR